jgi:integrase
MTSIRKRSWTAANGDEKQAWIVDYHDQGGTRRYKQFSRKKDAEAWRVNTEFSVNSGIHSADSQSMKVTVAAAIWLERPEHDGLEQTTMAAYEQHIRLHINPVCGGRKLSQITAPMVVGFRDQWLASLSFPMAKRVLRTFSAILNHAQATGKLTQNVALAVKMPRQSKRDQATKEIPKKSDIVAIIEASKASPDLSAHPLACIAIFSGLRASELRGLTWACVNLNQALLTVSQRADSTGQIGPPKSEAGNRTVPLPEMAVQACRKWKLACPPSDLGLVFPSLRGQVMSNQFMTHNVLGPVQIAAGITKPDGAPRFGLHAFRHAAASLWIEQRVSPKRVQAWMGHSSIAVTYDTYGKLFDALENDSAVANAVEAGLFAD